MRRAALVLVGIALLAAGCSGGDRDDSTDDQPDDPADVIEQFEFDEEELAELDELLNPDLADLEDHPLCDAVFGPGRPAAEVLADVSDYAICLGNDGEPMFMTTYRYQCPSRDSEVHYGMSPGPSEYGWGVDDGGDWRSWHDAHPQDECGG